MYTACILLWFHTYRNLRSAARIRKMYQVHTGAPDSRAFYGCFCLSVTQYTVPYIGDYRRDFRSDIGFIDHLRVVTTNNYNSFTELHTLQFTSAHSIVFSVCYYTFPGNGSNNVYSSASGSSSLFTDSRTELTINWVWVLYYDRRSVGQSVLEWSTHLGFTTRFLLLSDSCEFVDVGRSLWRGDGSVVYNCCWPRQRSYSQVRVPWHSWPYFTVSDSRLPFSSSPTTRRSTVEVFDPTSTRELDHQLTSSLPYNISARTT
jgi:hypothetical protein